MAAWIEPDGAGGIKVTVVTKRRYQLGVFTTMTDGTFHRQFAKAVEIVKSGKPLPLTRPKVTTTEPSDPNTDPRRKKKKMSASS